MMSIMRNVWLLLVGGMFLLPATAKANDGDGDGYEPPADCNDSNAEVYPGAREKCNDRDDDCDGQTDEGFDQDGDSWTTCMGDCSDTNAAIYPSATELCNGIDDDCDGPIDEQPGAWPDFDGDAFGHLDDQWSGWIELVCGQAVPDGYATNNTDCDNADPGTYPGAAETCDGKDNDCDGDTDEGVCEDDTPTEEEPSPTTSPDPCPESSYYPDADGDGYGDEDADSVFACSQPDGFVLDNTDCDDTNPDVYPGAIEVCLNDLDDNCDGVDVFVSTDSFPCVTDEMIPTPEPTPQATPEPEVSPTPEPESSPTPVEAGDDDASSSPSGDDDSTSDGDDDDGATASPAPEASPAPPSPSGDEGDSSDDPGAVDAPPTVPSGCQASTAGTTPAPSSGLLAMLLVAAVVLSRRRRG